MLLFFPVGILGFGLFFGELIGSGGLHGLAGDSKQRLAVVKHSLLTFAEGRSWAKLVFTDLTGLTELFALINLFNFW